MWRMRNSNPFLTPSRPRVFFISLFVKGCVWGTCHATSEGLSFFSMGRHVFFVQMNNFFYGLLPRTIERALNSLGHIS